MATYDDLAYLMGSFPELAVFRKFGSLAAKALLMKQAELLHFEQELELVAELDAASATPDVARSWEKMVDAATGTGSQRMEKLNELVPKLKSYYELLRLTEQVLKLHRPHRSNVTLLNSWLSHEQYGDNFLNQAGIEADAWGETTFTDLVALHGTQDWFSQRLADIFSPLHHRYIGQRHKKGVTTKTPGRLWHYTDASFQLIGHSLCMLLSSLLPILSIFVLYYLGNMRARLMAITVFSLTFSVLMTLVAQGRRYDVFAATTAFAAVQVVFVGGIDVTDKI